MDRGSIQCTLEWVRSMRKQNLIAITDRDRPPSKIKALILHRLRTRTPIPDHIQKNYSKYLTYVKEQI